MIDSPFKGPNQGTSGIHAEWIKIRAQTQLAKEIYQATKSIHGNNLPAERSEVTRLTKKLPSILAGNDLKIQGPKLKAFRERYEELLK